MNIVLLNGAMPNYDNQLNKVCRTVKDTLTELDVEVNEISLAYIQIPYFDGMKSKSVDELTTNIRNAEGIIFASTSSMYGISAMMLTLLEYFRLEEYKDIIKGKNCMVIVNSFIKDERFVIEQFSRIINSLGGYDSVRIGISGQNLLALDAEANKDIIEKQTEDFYRAVRQNRKYFFSQPGDEAVDLQKVLMPIKNITKDQAEALREAERRQKLKVSDVYDKLNLQSFTEKQQQDIDEISQLFAKKYTNPPEKNKNKVPLQMPIFDKQPDMINNVIPRARTCKQMTLSMPHYFQPQLAVGISSVIQINISGVERFDCYLVINNSECECIEGIVESPDITILSDTNIWMDVLKGKYTAQKAFMIGQLKVRGNFVILTKLEQLFKSVQM